MLRIKDSFIFLTFAPGGRKHPSSEMRARTGPCAGKIPRYGLFFLSFDRTHEWYPCQLREVIWKIIPSAVRPSVIFATDFVIRIAFSFGRFCPDYDLSVDHSRPIFGVGYDIVHIPLTTGCECGTI